MLSTNLDGTPQQVAMQVQAKLNNWYWTNPLAKAREQNAAVSASEWALLHEALLKRWSKSNIIQNKPAGCCQT